MKSRDYYKKHKDDRNGWKLSQRQVCWRCLKTAMFLEIHEILTRSKCADWAFRANYFLTCGDCHRYFGNTKRERLVEALAYKKIMDPTNHNLSEWLTRRDSRAMEFISEQEVEDKAQEILLQSHEHRRFQERNKQ